MIFDRYPYTDFHELNLDWVIAKVKEVINQNEQVLKELQDVKEIESYVKNYLETLDLYPDISKKIDELVESGAFSDIIQTAVKENHTLNMTMFLNIPTRSNVFTADEEEKPYWGQGSCVTSIGTFIGLSGNTGLGYSTIELFDNDTKLKKLSVNTDLIIHPNCMCYDEDTDTLYVIDSESIVGNSTLATFKGSTLTLIGTKTLPLQVRSIMLDNVTKRFYVMNGLDCYDYNPSNEDLTKKFSLPEKWRKGSYGIIQSGCVHNGILYEVSNSPDEIIKFSIADGSLIYEYPISEYYNIYPVNEIESLSFYNDKLYMCSVSGTGSRDNYRTTYVYETDLRQNNGLEKYNKSSSVFGQYQLFVDPNYSAYNADGSSAKPFQTISQAIQALSSPIARSGATIQIRLKGNCKEYVYARSLNFRIISDGDSDSYSVYGIQTWFCNCEFYRITINPNYPVDRLNVSPLYIEDCRIGMRYVTFNTGNYTGTTTSSGGTDTSYSRIYRSTVYSTGATGANVNTFHLTNSRLHADRTTSNSATYHDEQSCPALYMTPSNSPSTGGTYTFNITSGINYSLTKQWYDTIAVTGYVPSTDIRLYWEFSASKGNFVSCCYTSLESDNRLRCYILSGTITDSAIQMSISGWVKNAGSNTHTTIGSSAGRAVTSLQLRPKHG